MNSPDQQALTQEEHRIIREFEKSRPHELWIVSIGMTIAAVLFGLSIRALFM